MRKLCPEVKNVFLSANVPRVSLPLVLAGVRWRYRGLFSSLQEEPQLFLVVQREEGAWDNSSQQTWQLHFGFVKLSVLSPFTVNFFCQSVQNVFRTPPRFLSITWQPQKTQQEKNKYKICKLVAREFYSSHPVVFYLRPLCASGFHTELFYVILKSRCWKSDTH